MRNRFDLRAYPTPQGDAVRVRGSLSLPCDNDPKAQRVNTIQFEICLQDDPDALDVDPKDPSAVGPVIRGRLKAPLQELLNAATENRQLWTEYTRPMLPTRARGAGQRNRKKASCIDQGPNCTPTP